MYHDGVLVLIDSKIFRFFSVQNIKGHVNAQISYYYS